MILSRYLPPISERQEGNRTLSRRSFYAQFLCIIICAFTLTRTDAYYAPYFLAALFAVFCLIRNSKQAAGAGRALNIAVIVLSAFTAMLITLVNHRIWYAPAMPDVRTALFYRAYKLLLILFIFMGSFFSVRNMLMFISGTRETYPLARSGEGGKSLLYFFIPFAIFLAVYLSIFFSCYYPGILSLDSIDQISQMFTGVYSNHHPLCHTLLVQMFFNAGLAIFGDAGRAVAVYVIFQTVFMSASFAFLISTMKRMKYSRALIIASIVWCAIMPFHIMFSFTIWKDVVFGAFVMLFVLAAARIMNGIGNTAFNYVLAAICSVAFCLMRSNGLFAFVLVAAAVFFLMKKYRKLLIIMVPAIVISLIIKHGVFSVFNVTPPDTVESLSIPLQQVARVIVEDGDITDNDMALISSIIDVDEARASYDPGLSDPIKNLIRDYGCQDRIRENGGAFISMYVRTFAHNPILYAIAWADQTKGFWNSGYPCMVWYWDIEKNSFGIERTIMCERANTALGEYLWLFYNDPVFQIFVSIGLYVWVLLLMFFRSLSGRNTTALIATMPCVAIILSLVISTPAFSEFRYLYSLYCLLPFIIASSLTVPQHEPTEGDT